MAAFAQPIPAFGQAAPPERGRRSGHRLRLLVWVLAFAAILSPLALPEKAYAKSCYLAKLSRHALAQNITRQAVLPRSLADPRRWRWLGEGSLVGASCPTCLRVGKKRDLLYLGEQSRLSYFLADCGLIGLPAEQSLIPKTGSGVSLQESAGGPATLRGVVEKTTVETRPFILRDRRTGIVVNLGHAGYLRSLLGAEVVLRGRMLRGTVTVDMIGDPFLIEALTWRSVQPAR